MFSDQSGSSGSDVVPCIPGGADQTIENVQTDRNPNVNPRIDCSWWEMKHDTDDEAEECEDMLNDKEFVQNIANWGERAKIYPDEKGVCFDSFQILKVSFLNLAKWDERRDVPVGGQVSVDHSSCRRPRLLHSACCVPMCIVAVNNIVLATQRCNTLRRS